jgi:hypothetical protein
MKRYLVLVMSVLAISGFAQSAQGVVASVSGVDRMSMVKSSISVPSWHEKSFWPLYEKYMNKMEGTSSLTYRSLDELARMDKQITDEEAYQFGQNLLNHRMDELVVRQQYFAEISKSFNGIIAFQFIQTEVLLDLMESARIYEATPWKKFRFQPNALASTQLKTAKYNSISTAIDLPAEKAEAFYRIYTKYEDDCDALLDEGYSLYGLYAGEASDFTPALAKQLGHNLLLVMNREVKLKDKYFKEMRDTVGGVMAARFLAWEDYYSLVSKMHAWADAP